MYLKPKTHKTVPTSDEFFKLKQKLAGPFLKAKKTINIHTEFNSLLQKLKHLYITPISKSSLTEKTTEKIQKVHKLIYHQVKLPLFFQSQKQKSRVPI